MVCSIDIQDILTSGAKLPFMSCPACLSIQADCPDFRRTHAHLFQGTQPSKKLTNLTDVKRYLNFTCIAKDGLLVVPHVEPMSSTRERIVVPERFSMV